MRQVDLMARAAGRLDYIIQGWLTDALDELKATATEAVAEAFDEGYRQGRLGSPRKRTKRDRRLSAEIRAWALANGHPVAHHGRLPASARQAFEGRSDR
jgi:hypothetical protein